MKRLHGSADLVASQDGDGKCVPDEAERAESDDDVDVDEHALSRVNII